MVRMEYCPYCQRVTGHDRKVGVGTLLLYVKTDGLWNPLFYPYRCIVCGAPSTFKGNGKKYILLFIGLIFLVRSINSCGRHHNSTQQEQRQEQQ